MMSVPQFDEVVLEGQAVNLEPVSHAHHDELCAVVSDGELWKLFFTLVPGPEGIRGFIEKAIDDQRQGDGLTFVTRLRASHKIVGSTRFMKANLSYRKVEIGYTFIAQSHQRTCVNTEAKFLMLKYAFETLDLNRVEFLTDYFNHKSRNAILRLGAKQEGILRNHMVMPSGRIRDSVLFSIIKSEWNGVKENLLYKLNYLN